MPSAPMTSGTRLPGPAPLSFSPSSSSSASSPASSRAHASAVAMTEFVAAVPTPVDVAVAVVPTEPRLAVRALDAYFGAQRAVSGVHVDFNEGQVTAIIGPSGCGKSTLLRCINRMHETVPTARVEGEVLLDGRDIYARGVNAIEVRRRIGMVFQRPTPFPTMSIRDNVVAGLRAAGRNAPSRAEQDEIAEWALRRTALWDEVKDRLPDSAMALSGSRSFTSSHSAVRRSAHSAISSCSARDGAFRPAARNPATTLSRMDIVGNGVGRWKTMPMRRRTSMAFTPRA